MKERYLDLMEQALSAYSNARIGTYYTDVKEHGLREHGFARLTANVGILIAHGRRRELLPAFADMMELCLQMMQRKNARSANEFSVRELLCCIEELEAARAVDAHLLLHWKELLSHLEPETCYDVLVKEETDRITNWAIFGAVSEYKRNLMGLSDTMDFVERQLSCQMQWLDENGMYRDNAREYRHQPFVYDIVSRGLLTLLLHFGYRGKYYGQIDNALRRAGLVTLRTQSPNGELPFGGRSNQFLHNEPWMATVFEYEACRYAREGNLTLAKEFKAGALRALAVTEEWLSRVPIRHIKNRFPTETGYGCED